MKSILEQMDQIQEQAGEKEPMSGKYPRIIDGARDNSEGLAPESYHGQGNKFPLPRD